MCSKSRVFSMRVIYIAGSSNFDEKENFPAPTRTQSKHVVYYYVKGGEGKVKSKSYNQICFHILLVILKATISA